MDENTMNRRAILGGMAAAGAAGALGAITPLDAAAQAATASAPAPDAGPSQAPTITDVKGKVVYITGGSSGIGLGIARVLHEAGANVVIGNLDDKQFPDALKNFPAGDPRIFTVVHDVMDKDGWQRTADAIEKKYGAVNILINNAGVGLQQSASAGTLKDWEWGMGVNFWGPVHGVRTFLPRMKAHNEGAHIATVCSISGMFAGSGNGIYTVSKYATCGLMEELRVELHETNIGTSVIFPGFTATNIGKAESYRPERLRNPPGTAAPPRPAPAGPAPARVAQSQMDPMEVAYCLLDGIVHNDLFIFSHPEWKTGTKMRFDAILASFVDRPVPAARVPADPLRTPVFAREIAHRQRTAKRKITTV